MGESKVSFLFMDILLLVVMLGLTFLVFKQRGGYFILGLLFLLFYICFSFIAMIGIYNDSNWGWTLLSFIFGIILLEMAYMYSKNMPAGRVFLTTTVLSVVGFVTSILSIRKTKTEKTPEVEVIEEEKYVASKTGKKYHKESCDWAKKINPKNRIALTKEEAKKKNLKPCSCVKG